MDGLDPAAFESEFGSGLPPRTPLDVDSVMDTNDVAQIGSSDLREHGQDASGPQSTVQTTSVTQKGAPKPKCPHGRRKYRCKECLGDGICQHRRQRNNCKECNGNSICFHGIRKTNCKECNGSAICSHGKVRFSCKECRSSLICQHGRRSDICIECHGTSICQHGKQKRFCASCKGDTTCRHGIAKRWCTDCKGYRTCSHGSYKYSCKKCKKEKEEFKELGLDHLVGRVATSDSAVQKPKAPVVYARCAHNKTRCCIECAKVSPCPHGSTNDLCPTCHNLTFCHHKRLRNSCRWCMKEHKATTDGL